MLVLAGEDRQRGGGLVDALHHPNHFSVVVLDRHAQDLPRAIAGGCVDSPVEAVVLVGVLDVEDLPRGGDRSYDALVGLHTDLLHVVGNFAPQLFLFFVEDEQGSPVRVHHLAHPLQHRAHHVERVQRGKGHDVLDPASPQLIASPCLAPLEAHLVNRRRDLRDERMECLLVLRREFGQRVPAVRLNSDRAFLVDALYDPERPLLPLEKNGQCEHRARAVPSPPVDLPVEIWVIVRRTKVDY
mmetsp:Transcript_4828/g.12211  ORF Transcript_4828/g.12211 Transcript_4828/m.12211 type:complete len:242 (-) Transcript_4828:1138-1863(-)